MNAIKKYSSFSDMDQFIGSLRKEDNWNINFTRIILVIMLVIGILYSVFILLTPSPYFDIVKRIGGACYVLAVFLFILILGNLIKDYKDVDYGLPVVEMLRQVIKRYSIYQKKYLWAIFPMMLADASMVLMTVNPHNWSNLVERILWAQQVFILSLAFGAAIGYSIWHYRQRPLRNAAIKMLKELES